MMSNMKDTILFIGWEVIEVNSFFIKTYFLCMDFALIF